MAKMSPRGEALSRILFAQHDKPERVKALYGARNAVPVGDLAIIFGEVWTNSENLFQAHQELEEIIHHLRESNAAHLMMDSQERGRLRMIRQKPTTVLYRGCGEHNVHGFSWTTNKAMAAWFANRSALDGQPVLATARFQSADLVAYFRGRNEKEVVVDISTESAKTAIDDGELTYLPPIPVSGSKLLAWKVQAYGDAGLYGDENADRMLGIRASFAKAQGLSLDDLVVSMSKNITRLEEFGDVFAEKIAETHRQIEVVKKAYEVEIPDEFSRAVQAQLGT